MRRWLVSISLAGFSLPLASATLPELFVKAKQEFKLGNYQQSLSTLETLDAESAKPGLEGERERILPGLLFYRGAVLAALGRSEESVDVFQEFLVYQPNAQLDPALYPRSVIAALDRARKTAGQRRESPEDSRVLATSYRTFRMTESPSPSDTGERWSEGPAKYLLTSDERRSFDNLADPLSRSDFITSFWKSHDSRPETPENEFREEFERRVRFADARFTQDEIRGSLTDRGMVFILLGPPTYSGKRPLTTGDDQGAADASGLSRYGRAEVESAYHSGGSSTDRMARIAKVTGPDANIRESASNWIEVWHYLRADLPKGVPYQELALQFLTKAGYGKNVLQREANVVTAIERAKSDARRGAIVAGATGP